MTISAKLNLADLQAAFAEWRETRQPRSVPTALRVNTLALLGQHPTGEILRTLGINHSMLRRWKDQQGIGSGPAFVALPGPGATSGAERTVGPNRDTAVLNLTIRREADSLALSGELSLAQWRAALSLLA
jgi:hypothetical protein